MDAALICALMIVFGIVMYVILDGFDLGIGILFPWAPADESRNLMMSSIAPVWDGNETWLIYGGGILFAAFPKAFAVLLPALYIPIMVMLFALIFRGVAFEFRMKAKQSRWIWDTSFTVGSMLAAFAQGLIVGAVIHGFKVVDGRYAGGSFDWLTSFGITCGFAMILAYAFLGAAWLVMKTGGATRDWARSITRPLAVAMAGFLASISMKTPLEYHWIAERWFSLPNFVYLSPIPLATVALFVGLFRGLRLGRDRRPFYCAVGIFLLGFVGLAVSLWPYFVLPAMTFWQAAAPASSLNFVLVLVAISLPITVGYTAFVYKIFRGKVKPEHSYY